MNNEVNNNVNNELNVKSSNNSKIIIVVLVILLIGGIGFICYDKFINKEKLSAPISSSESEYNGLTVINLTQVNQVISIAGKTYQIRNESNSEQSFLFINDEKVNSQQGNDYYIYAEKAYLFNDIALFTKNSYCGEQIVYAMGKFQGQDNVTPNILIVDNSYHVSDLKLENSILHAKGIPHAFDNHADCYNDNASNVIINIENSYISIVKNN